VLLANVPVSAAVVEQLERYVDKRGEPADHARRPRRFAIDITSSSAPSACMAGCSLANSASGSRARRRMSAGRRGHPATAGFESGALGNLTNVTFAERYRIEPQASDTCCKPMAAIRCCCQTVRTGPGDVVCSSIDRDWTNLPLSPLFFP